MSDNFKEENGSLDLSQLVENLSNPEGAMAHIRPSGGRQHVLPSRERIVELTENLRSILFPGYFGREELNFNNTTFHIGALLDKVKRLLVQQIQRIIIYQNEDLETGKSASADEAEQITDTFLSRLPQIQQLLATDVKAAYERDPAAKSHAETVFCYPGIIGITNHRIAHEFYQLGVPLLPRIISEYAHSSTGIDIHPGARIGREFFMDHGTGIVIGETCIIGERVRIYQGVTLGARNFPADENGNLVKGIQRHPIVEDDVVIYGGANILGRITIGSGSVIGGNVWLTRSVPAGSKVVQARNRDQKFSNGGGI